MELRRSQNRTRISKRTPLSNLTNAQALSSSSSSAFSLGPKPKISDPRSSFSAISNHGAIFAKSRSRFECSAPKNPKNHKISNRDSPIKEIATDSVADASSLHKSKNSVVYTRRNTDGRKDEDKDVTASVTLSCLPRERNRFARAKLKAEGRDAAAIGASSISYKKSKKLADFCGRTPEIQKHAELDDVILEESSTPPDYIEKQRAYFAEIDAYDLAEESVSESELE